MMDRVVTGELELRHGKVRGGAFGLLERDDVRLMLLEQLEYAWQPRPKRVHIPGDEQHPGQVMTYTGGQVRPAGAAPSVGRL
jgi:hypothetical protein